MSSDRGRAEVIFTFEVSAAGSAFPSDASAGACSMAGAFTFSATFCSGDSGALADSGVLNALVFSPLVCESA